MTFLTRLPARPRTIDEPLAHWAKENPDGEAVKYGERSWTWGEWNDRVRRAAGGLRALGVGRGDVVAFLDKNHPACVEITLAAGSLGAAHAIVNWRSAGDEVDYAVNDCGAKVLFVGDRADADHRGHPGQAHERREDRLGHTGRCGRRRVRSLARGLRSRSSVPTRPRRTTSAW